MSEVPRRRPPGIPPRRIGVLLVNLGTPDATDYWSMRRYLKEFLSDRRVIEENRAQMVAGAQSHHSDRAPRPQRPRLRQDLEQGAQQVALSRPSRARSPTSSPESSPRRHAIPVDWAMRYGNPSIGSRLDALPTPAATAS